MNFVIIHPLGHVVAYTSTYEEAIKLCDTIYTHCDYQIEWITSSTDDSSKPRQNIGF